MKRCGVCLGILAGLIIICICSLLVIKQECDRFGTLAVSVSDSLAEGSTEATLERFDTLQAEWESFHNVCGLFVNGQKLDPIRETLSELRPLIAQEHPEAVPAMERLKGLIESIYEEEFPAVWHIL